MPKLEKTQMIVLAVAGIFLLIGGFYKDGGIPWVPDVIVVDDAPIKVEGPHMLLLYEAADTAVESIDSVRKAGEVRKWLDANSYVWNAYDKDLTPAHDSPQWIIDAYQLHDGSVPWILIANSKSGYVGAVPEKSEDLIALLEKYK